MDAYDAVSIDAGTPQTEAADPRQRKNSAGGYAFTLDDAAHLRRFLVLGTAQGTYYSNSRSHTKQAANVVIQMAERGDHQLLEQILDVSLGGLAPKQEPTLLALAVACASPDDKLRADALAAVPRVCRTFTMLSQFCQYVGNQRGWGRGLRSAVARFYEDRTADQAALQVVKYRQRNGWTHRDVLRKVHPAAPSPEHVRLYNYICDRTGDPGQLPAIVQAFNKVQSAGVGDAKSVATTVAEVGLPWEAIPDELVNTREVLEALAPGMGATALIRQLPRLARAGMTSAYDGAWIADRLSDETFIKAGRVHPYQVLLARLTYASGHSARGSSVWTPSPQIVSALEVAYEHAFQNIEPAGKNTGVFLDVSGSMGWAFVDDSHLLDCRTAAAAMAMATVRTEPKTIVAGFTDSLEVLDITSRDSLSSVVAKTGGLPFGSTDCAQPMIWALEHAPTTETFIVYTDNETWSGYKHPHQALKTYRKKTGIDARLVVVGMAATNFTIADPSDPGMLDVVGFDASAPRVIAEFSAGRI